MVSVQLLAYTAKIDGIYYNFSGTNAEVTYSRNSAGYSGKVMIPESVTYNEKNYPVTRIGYAAFNNCHGLTSVTIPNSVMSIGDEAFFYCSGLTSVEIPNSVTSIGSHAFDGCSSLTSVAIPNSVTSIGSYAFYGCSSLTSMAIPNSITNIGEHAFNDTGIYTNAPDGEFYVDKWVCGYKGEMPSNTSVSLKNGTVGIANAAFSGCSGLTSVDIPSSITSIGYYAFEYCSGLISVTIPSRVASIGHAAF